MIQKILLSMLLLTFAVGTAVALELEPAVDAVAPDQPEVTAKTLDLTELLAVEAPPMSVEPERTEGENPVLPLDLSWPHGICYPNTCFPCTSNASCPLGDRCVFGAICP